MQIKVFHAFTMQEAIRSIKAELGPDAVILSTKDVRQRGAVAKWFGRPLIEVTAAAEPRTVPAKPAEKELVVGDSLPGPSIVPPSRFQETLNGLVHDAGASSLTQQSGRSPSSQQPGGSRRPSRASARLDRLRSELQGLHRHLLESYPGDAIPTPKNVPRSMTTVFRDFIDRGLDLRTAVSFVQSLHATLGDECCGDRGTLRRALRALVRQELADALPAAGCRDGRKVSLFFGPSGVGKTTAIAKLASQYVMEQRRSVALMTLDAYRAAAVEQLRSYAAAMEIPMETALTRQDAAEALRRLADADVILIDSGGRTFSEASYLHEVRWLTTLDLAVDTHLVLSATTREEDLLRTVRRCDEVPVSRLLFTKLDETGGAGSLLAIQKKSGIPLSYFSTGPRVPHDLEEASSNRLADLLLDGCIREERDWAGPLRQVATESLAAGMPG
ncbi:MAG TPA: flagellar biosynthesis protein FlhF [Nitrospira sp.]|nr:flagellar biosynthesis protein FlhF [Nitrospira sp.]